MKTLVLTLLFASAALAQNAPKASKFPDDIRVEANVAYLPEGRTEKADLYFPREVPKDKLLPAVLIIHGGGFVGGVRDAAREINIGSTLARSGYAAMSIDYKVSKSEVIWPQNLHDCKTAVRWLRKNATRLQIDPQRIGVIGGSAGGHLAAMVAMTGPQDGLDPAQPDGDISCRVRCAVDLYGPNDLLTWHDVAMLGKKRSEDAEIYRKASPTNYASKDDPPMLLLHGTSDTTVHHSQSELLAEALKKAGVEHELVLIPGAAHTFHLQPKQRDLRPLVLGFFDKHLKGDLR